MQSIRSVKIEGYKSIKKAQIDLGDANVFIGANGSGKSNLISVFRLLESMFDGGLQLFSSMSSRDSLFYKGTKTTNEIRIEIDYDSSIYGFVLSPAEDHRIVFADEYASFEGGEVIHLGKGHYECLVTQLDAKHPCYNLGQQLKKESWKIYHFQDTGTYGPARTECSIVNSARLLPDASNLAAMLYRIKEEYPKTYFRIIHTIRMIAPWFDDFHLQPTGTYKDIVSLSWKQKDCPDVFHSGQLSDGTLRFICLATLLLQPRELLPDTVIIDEPELSLHPMAIGLLASLLEKAAKKCQLIVATQSVELLNEIDPADVVVVEMAREGSKFSRLDPDALKLWLDGQHSLGELWARNVIGGGIVG